MKKVKLGNTDIKITPIGLGCWQFSRGVGFAGKYWDNLETGLIDEIVKVSLDEGINWFDTAEVYGWGNSEKSIAEALQKNGIEPGKVVIATKWHPVLRTAKSILKTFDKRLEALSGYPVDLHQIHAPYSFSSIRNQMQAMAQLLRDEKIKAVGVSNFSAEQMRTADDVLKQEGFALASNQVRYSLLDRKVERKEVLAAAKERGITIIAYSPLAQGILSGKFHENPELIKERSGPRKVLSGFKEKGLKKSEPLIERLRALAESYKVTPAQIALNWTVHFHGDLVVTIPGATSTKQAGDNARALSFKLKKAELEELDAISRSINHMG